MTNNYVHPIARSQQNSNLQILEQTLPSDFEKSIAFLEQIGITIIFKNIEAATLLPGLSIEDGCINIDKQRLSFPGDVLHEAGHIAVIPASERQTLNSENIDIRQDAAAEEMMAIAWSYAACLHLQIDPCFVFHENGYKGSGSHIVDNFKQGNYFGVPMLQWVGMALERKSETEPEKPFYPAMLQWVRN